MWNAKLVEIAYSALTAHALRLLAPPEDLDDYKTLLTYMQTLLAETLLEVLQMEERA